MSTKSFLCTCLLVCFTCLGAADAGVWPSGHFRLGFGADLQSEGQSFDMGSEKIAQLSFDLQPWLLPLYVAVDAQLGAESSGEYVSQGGGVEVLRSKADELTLGVKYYQSLALLDVYVGLGGTYQRLDQEHQGNALLRRVKGDGLGYTAILGVTDLQLLLPVLQWGVEVRFSKINTDAIVDVDPKMGTWLLTCGLGW